MNEFELLQKHNEDCLQLIYAYKDKLKQLNNLVVQSEKLVTELLTISNDIIYAKGGELKSSDLLSFKLRMKIESENNTLPKCVYLTHETCKEYCANPVDCRCPNPIQGVQNYNPMKNAFSGDFIVKKGTKVVSLGSRYGVPNGTKGIAMEDESIPYIDWEEGKYRTSEIEGQKINAGHPASSHQLAPLNPTDHPNYPNLNWE